jgi:hypothetical protein
LLQLLRSEIISSVNKKSTASVSVVKIGEYRLKYLGMDEILNLFFTNINQTLNRFTAKKASLKIKKMLFAVEPKIL